MKNLIKHYYRRHKETIYNFIWRFLQILGKEGVVFLIFILCARSLTPYDFGVYNYILAAALFLIMFGDFGISSATSKYVAEYNITDKDKLKSVLFNAGLIIFGITILLTVLTLLFGPGYFKEKYHFMLYVLPLIFLAPMTSLYDGIYRGLKQFKRLAIISSLSGILSVIFTFLLITKYGLVGALISQNILYLISLIGLGLGYREFDFKINRSVMAEIAKYSTVIGVGTLGYYLYTDINILLLGSFGYIKEVGYFSLVNNLFAILVFPFIILGQIIAPNITRYVINKDYSNIRKKYVKYIIYTLIIGIFISILLFFCVPPIMKLFLSKYLTPNFLMIFNHLLMILPLSFLSAILVQGFTVAMGKANYMLLAIPFGLVNIFVTYFFMSKFGFMGAVYGLIVSTTLNRVITYILLFFDLKQLDSNS